LASHKRLGALILSENTEKRRYHPAVAQTSLTKTERKLVSSGASKASSRLKGQARSRRLMGVTVAIAAAKLDASMGDMSPSIAVPVIGEQKATTIIGALFLANYALSRNPSTIGSALGYAGLGVVCRSF
jgi:hypothetical protein